DLAGGRGRPRDLDESGRGQGAAADRQKRRCRGVDRAHARARSRGRGGERPVSHGICVEHGRRQAGRSRRHIGDRRDLSQGLRDRNDRDGRARPRPVPRDCGEAGRGCDPARRSSRRAGTDDAKGVARGREVKVAAAVVAIVVALAVQTTVTGFKYDGTAAIDLLLVLPIYTAVTGGAGSGLPAASLAGLLQDSLSSGILGIGALAKTIVAYLAGLASTQFILNGPLQRFFTFFLATVAH